MPSLLEGTVTLLFADIEGSTRLLQELRHRYAGVLSDYRRLARSSFAQRGGREIDTQGDAFFVAFPRALDALDAAIAAQRAIAGHPWPDTVPVRVRMGIHTGEPTLGETGYVGIDVHRAARICAAAHGGQILVSQTTRQLIEADLPEDVILRDLGEWRLKDLTRPERLFQVVTADLPAQFPPPRSLETASNLPRQLTSFVGRAREIAEIRDRLERAVLLTLTGTGGSGKTRLALEVAAAVLDEYADGVWWVQLAPLTEPDLVPQAVATALGVREQRGVSVKDSLLDALRHKNLLMVLDNAEHVIAACADLIDALLRTCPALRMLVTSRESLRIEGEHVYPVPPLALPAAGTLAPVPMLGRSEAVQLFVDRATAARPSFALNEQNAAAVLQICRRLDGIPLAVELAAARVRALSVEQIAARLDDQFRLLADESRTALPRHQALRATMDWSYGLLSEAEQRLFRHLSVFAGSYTLEAAEAVCSASALERQEILDLLTRLLEKSMVVGDEVEGVLRYRLLEPVRQYAVARLEGTEEGTEVRLRHRGFFLGLAERGHEGLATADRLAWRTRIEAEHDNIRAALGWALSRGDIKDAAELGAAMARFWASRGYLQEGRTWLGEVRRDEERLPPRTLAKLLTGVGLLAFEIGEHEQAMVTEQALVLFQQLNDGEGVEVCVRLLGMVQLERGQYDRAAPLLEEAARVARERGDPEAEAEALRQRGYLATKQGDYGLATQLLEQSLAAVQNTGRRRSIGFALGHLAQTLLYMGHVDRAVGMLKEALDHMEAVDHGTGTAYFLNVLALALLKQGDHQAAAGIYRRCLEFARETGYRWAIAQSLIGFGALAGISGVPRPAASLLAAADTLLHSIDYAIPAAEQTYLESAISDSRATLSPEEFAVAWKDGERLSLEDAVGLALRVGRGTQPGAPPTPAPAGTPTPRTIPVPPTPTRGPTLSLRERQVAVLVTRGQTNREIATALGISEKTASVHVQHIMNKLGVNSRAQIAAWAAALGLTTVPDTSAPD